MGCYVIYGNEPWAIRKQKENFKLRCENPVYGYQEFDAPYAAQSFLCTFNLFTDQLYATLCVPDTKMISSKDYLQFMSGLKENKSKYLLVIVDKVTEKDRGISKIKEVATVIPYSKITAKDKLLRQQVDYIVKQQDAVIEPAAVDMLLDRLDYSNHEETNLLTVENYIGQLKYLSDSITVDDVVRNTPDLREGKRFKIASMLAQGNIGQLLDEAERLKREKDFNAFGLLAILFKEYRVAYLSKLGYSVREQGAFSNTMGNMPVEKIVQGMNIIGAKLRDIKTGVYSEEEAFDITLTELVCLKEM